MMSRINSFYAFSKLPYFHKKALKKKLIILIKAAKDPSVSLNYYAPLFSSTCFTHLNSRIYSCHSTKYMECDADAIDAVIFINIGLTPLPDLENASILRHFIDYS